MKNQLFGEIHRMGTMNSLSEKDRTLLSEINKTPNNPGMEMLLKEVHQEASNQLDQFYKALDVQFKAVYDKAISDGVIKGKPTKSKFKKAGFDVCYHEGVGTYIRRNGERVSEIVSIKSEI